MYKWRGASLGLPKHAAAGVFSDTGECAASDKSFQTRLVFEGGTHFLKKLHAHRSVLQPGGGYAPHADPYDVLIALFEGTVQTMGRTVTAPAFLYHPAGSLHGIRALSESPARYLVVEMHGAEPRDDRGRRRIQAEWSMVGASTARISADWTVRRFP
ncbi:cupin domain-containing protein [Nordella sp. HKS 07]|uniref:cupin domain-containing protein n=1 Tax=Nordella sp. HKS 07 TaxID=2712222 RepID=UPI0019D2EBF3|nr:hypothetical protein [Nordella sp. HKS 07]